MVVKAKRGRKRYILFVIEGMGKDVIRNMMDECIVPLKLISYDRKFGIVRCKHIDKDVAIEWLNSLSIRDHSLLTLKTSGTLRVLKKHLMSIRVGEAQPGDSRLMA